MVLLAAVGGWLLRRLVGLTVIVSVVAVIAVIAVIAVVGVVKSLLLLVFGGGVAASSDAFLALFAVAAMLSN